MCWAKLTINRALHRLHAVPFFSLETGASEMRDRARDWGAVSQLLWTRKKKHSRAYFEFSSILLWQSQERLTCFRTSSEKKWTPWCTQTVDLLFTKRFVDGRICEHTKRMSGSQGRNASSGVSELKATVKQKADNLKQCSLVVITQRTATRTSEGYWQGWNFVLLGWVFSAWRGESNGEGKLRHKHRTLNPHWFQKCCKLFFKIIRKRTVHLRNIATSCSDPFVLGRREWFSEIPDSTTALRRRLTQENDVFCCESLVATSLERYVVFGGCFLPGGFFCLFVFFPYCYPRFLVKTSTTNGKPRLCL